MIHHQQHGQRCDKADERPFHETHLPLVDLLYSFLVVAARPAALLMLAAHLSLAFSLSDGERTAVVQAKIR